MPYGRQVLYQSGTPLRVSVDGSPQYKVGGITVDWSQVQAAQADLLVPVDNTPVRAGQKYIQYGTIMVLNTSTGLYQPYASGGANGTGTLTSGQCFIIDETVVQSSPFHTGGNYDNPAVFDGGRAWQPRLQIGGTGQPTLTQFIAAFPRVQLVTGN